MILGVGSEESVRVPVIFLAKGTLVHPRFRGTNLLIRYVLPEVSCVIPKIAACMDDETWEKLVKVVSPGIRKMKVSNDACVFPILFSTYLTLHLCPSKLY